MTTHAWPHPTRACRFGRQHSYSSFPYIEGRFACAVCGIENDDAWWTEEGRYVGPDEGVVVDQSQSGWLLRRPDSTPAKWFAVTWRFVVQAADANDAVAKALVALNPSEQQIARLGHYTVTVDEVE